MARLEILPPDAIADPELRRMALASDGKVWLELDPRQMAALESE